MNNVSRKIASAADAAVFVPLLPVRPNALLPKLVLPPGAPVLAVAHRAIYLVVWALYCAEDNKFIEKKYEKLRIVLKNLL